MVTAPQDHMQKQTAEDEAPQPFTFTDGKGKEWTLPFATVGREKMSGGDFEDAVLAGEIGMMAYLVKALHACGADAGALKALRALPQLQYLEIINEWGDYGDGDGASLGESSR